MRNVAVAAAVVLLAASTVAADGFSVFGSYDEITDQEEVLGFGVRYSFGGDSGLVADITASIYEKADEEYVVGDVLIDGGTVVADKLEVIPLELGLRWIFDLGRVRPYLGGGVTWFITDYEIARVDDEVGFYALGGLSLRATDSVAAFLEVRYRQTDVTTLYDDQDVLTDRVELDTDIGGVGGSIGVTWVF